MRDAKVTGAQFPADFFDLQLNCNQNWIREKSEAKSLAIRTVFHHFFNKLQLKKIFLSTKIVKNLIIEENKILVPLFFSFFLTRDKDMLSMTHNKEKHR